MAEDISGLPDVDLSGLDLGQDDDQDKAQGNGEPEPVKTQVPEIPPAKDVQDQVAMDLAQFKTPEALLKSYKELQGAFTKKSQEYKALEAKQQELEEQIQLSRTPVASPQADPQFDDNFIDNPQMAIQQAILRQRVVEILEEEQDKNQEGFQERYAYAQRVLQQYPQLQNSAVGIKKAFAYGDKLRASVIKQSSSKLMETLFGEPLNEEELENLKQIVKGKKQTTKPRSSNSNAYMPDTDTSTNRTPDLNQNLDIDAKIAESERKGDVDGVLDGMFQKILSS